MHRIKLMVKNLCRPSSSYVMDGYLDVSLLTIFMSRRVAVAAGLSHLMPTHVAQRSPVVNLIHVPMPVSANSRSVEIETSLRVSATAAGAAGDTTR